MRHRSWLGVLAALALPPCLAGCTPDPAPVVAAPRPVLPAAPAFAGCPVDVRAPRAGDDVRLYAARERAGRLAANRCFADFAGFYRDVALRFGADEAPSGEAAAQTAR